MKLLSIFTVLLSFSGLLQAQVGKNLESQEKSSYQVVERGANHRRWQRALTLTNEAGHVTSHTNSYEELETGMYYQENGEWKESKAEIKLDPKGARASEGGHKVIFSPNINTAGAIDLSTADGKRFRSHVLGLSYLDAATGQSVLIAEVKDSIGELLPPNQVIYADAFTDFKADIRYTYSKAGFEQDIIFREKPPTPDDYGLNPETTLLQVLTEFLEPPPAQKEIENIEGRPVDKILNFGEMSIGSGKAFAENAGRKSIRVDKHWQTLDGRNLLIEEINADSIKPLLGALPSPHAAAPEKKTGNKIRHLVSRKQVLPGKRVAKLSMTNLIQVASLPTKQEGLVIDYALMSSATNFVFKGDTTYYVTNSVFLSGTTVIEGGTVIKYGGSGSVYLSTAVCKTASYRPAVFTSKDDNSVGEIISGSTGNPSGFYGDGLFIGAQSLHDIRFSHANFALVILGHDFAVGLTNVQFIKCTVPITCGGDEVTINLNNGLFYAVGTLVENGIFTLNASHITVHQCDILTAATDGGSGSSVSMTNSLLVAVTNLGNVTYTTNNSAVISSDAGIFQTVGAASHYLATNSIYRDIGTTNINLTLLAELNKKTTYPPIDLTHHFTNNLTLSSQAQRDTDIPDLGYHYDPLDYCIGNGRVLAAATLTLTNGVAVGLYNTDGGTFFGPCGLMLDCGARLVSDGSALNLNRVVWYNTVQEQSTTNFVGLSGIEAIAYWGSYDCAPVELRFRFTDFSRLAGSGAHIGVGDIGLPGTIFLRDSQFRGGSVYFNSPSAAISLFAGATNCLFERCALNCYSSYSNLTVNAYNNLFYGGPIDLFGYDTNSASTVLTFRDNFFYTNQITQGTNLTLVHDHNAYLTNAPRLSPNGTGDVILTNFTFSAGPLGYFYQPTNSPLINVGSQTANNAGLYHLTTTTNQVKETNSTVDIGFHYIALGTNGAPIDSDNDGTFDYIEDSDGDGCYEPRITSEPTTQTICHGSNVTFTAGTDGESPLGFQWYYNSTNLLSGATNASLTLTNVQFNQAGYYSVRVTNVCAVIFSSDALLTVVAPPIFTLQPSDLKVNLTSNATFSVTISSNSTTPVSFQWLQNGNILSGATNSSLTLSNVQIANVGYYSVIATNVAGSNISTLGALTATILATNFTNDAALQVNSDATLTDTDDGHVLQLTPSAANQAGSAFFLTPISLISNASFSTAFSFRMDKAGGSLNAQADTNSGADGIVFVVQTLTNNVGSDGGGMGYFGVTNSVGVEFDTWGNHCDAPGTCDPFLVGAIRDGNHIGIDYNGFLTNTTIGGMPADGYSAVTAHVTNDLNNTNIWYAWVDYDGTNLEVRLSESINNRPMDPILTNTVNLLNYLQTNKAYLGFTAGTGGAYNQQDVLSWQFISPYHPIDATNSIPPTNIPPSVSITNLTNNQVFVFSPTNILISATGSDSDGSITNVEFYSGATLIGNVTNVPYDFLWTNVVYGTKILTAKAYDNSGASTISVAVTNLVNSPPSVSITGPTNLQHYTNPANVLIEVDAGDIDGTVTNVQFFHGTNLWGSDSMAPFSFTTNGVAVGAYPITAVAFDDLGVSSVSSITVFLMNSTNTPPDIAITYPTNNAAFSSDEEITITATVTNGTDNTLTNVQFFLGTNYLGNDAASPFSVTEYNLKPGTFTLVSMVTDGLGLKGFSQPVTFTVSNQAPVSGEGFWDPVFGNPGTFDLVQGNIGDGMVLAVAKDRTLFAIGRYAETINNVQVSGCGKWDGIDWHPLGDGGTNSLVSKGYALKSLMGQSIFSGGSMVGIYNTGLAKWDGTNWIQIGDDLTVDGIAKTRSIALMGSDVYIGGEFTNDAVRNIAKLEGGYWIPVGSDLNGTVHALAVLDNQLYVGGNFTNAGASSNLNYLVRLDGTNWVSVGEGVNDRVRALLVSGDSLYVGGDFTVAGAHTNANHVAKWDGVEWTTVGNGVDGPLAFYGPATDEYAELTVSSFALRGHDLFVGGSFGIANPGDQNIPVRNIARATWSEASQQWIWSELDKGLCMPLEHWGEWGNIASLAIREGENAGAYDLFAAGQFLEAGSGHLVSKNIARWSVGRPNPTNAPQVSITLPAMYDIFTDPTEITNLATVISANAAIDVVDFYMDGVWFDQAAESPYEVIWNTPTLGFHRVMAVATDENGIQGQSTNIGFFVKSSTNSVEANEDFYSMFTDDPTTNFFVLANDIGGPLQISDVSRFGGQWGSRACGSVKIGHDGTYLIYTPFSAHYGTDIITYAVTNASGESAISSVEVKLRAKPTVQIENPSDGDGFLTNASVSFTGIAKDYDGEVTNVSLWLNGVSIDQNTNADFSFTWDTNTPGFYIFEAVAVDNEGVTNSSDRITIIVTNDTASLSSPVAIISNLTSIASRQSPIEFAEFPVIREGFFNLQGQALDPDIDDPVAYQVLLFRPEDEDTTATDDPFELIRLTKPYANLTSGILSYGGFHDGSANGELGTLDFTAVPNGVYDLVLRVLGGADETNAIVRIQLDTQLKIGQFSFSEQDLAIPVSGIPLTITRTYNSMNPRAGDFGYGWSYTLNSMDVELNEQREDVTVGNPNAPFADDEEDDYGRPRVVSIRTGGGHDVTLTLPDGRRTTFAFKPWFSGISMRGHAKWETPSGIHATLTPIGSEYIDVFPSLHWFDGGANSTFDNHDVSGWILETQDGTKYFITRGEANNVIWDESRVGHYVNVRAYGPPKLTRIEQRSGDVITISDRGIEHYANGTNLTRAVSIERNSLGRIIAVRDPNSGSNGLPTMKYIYNRDTGNLIQVHRLVNRETSNYTINKYHYDHPRFLHYITSIEDPRGVPIAKNFYDDSGKLIEIEDADGKRTKFIHDTTNRLEIVIDQLGYGSTNHYDPRGNIDEMINALGQTNHFEHDDKDRLVQSVDPLGHTNSFGYDENGFRNATTNALGQVTLFGFDDHGQLLSKTDALTNSIGFEYDSAGHRIEVVDALGHTNKFGHDIYGRPTAVTNALGQLRATAGSDSIGDLQFVSQANGLRMDYGHDLNGNTTNTSFVWINPDDTNQTNILVTFTELDAANRVTRIVDPDGQERQTIYDVAGRVAQSIDRLGNTNSYLYDARGNLIQTTYPDGTVTRNVYDARKQIEFTTDRYIPNETVNGSHTLYDALGRAWRTERIADVQIDIVQNGIVFQSVLSSTGAVLSASSTAYDEAGRVRFSTNAIGRVTEYQYDATGRQTAVIDALTNRTDYVYDDGGHLRFVTNALQQVTEHIYDAKGRRFKTIFPDTSYITNGYNEIGQLFATRDQAGLITNFEYDDLGRMKAIIKPEVFNPDGGTNARPRYEYEYDKFGNVLVIRDAKGRETKSTYDAFGQLISRKLPLLETNFNNYNALGQLDYSVDFKRQTNSFIYDSRGRIVTNYLYAVGALIPTQTNSIEYGAGGRFISNIRPEGVTTLKYDINGAVTNILSPESTIDYEYDPTMGYLTRAYTTNSDIQYDYDELNRLKTVTAVKRNGTTLTVPEVTTNAYTKLGSLEYVYFPNGTRTFYEYNSMNHLTNMVHYNSANQVLARYEYTVDSDGQRLASKETRRETGGSYSTTDLVWTNDALHRLVWEGTSSTVAALNFTNSYVYDLVGNRLWKTNVSSAGTVVTGYTYDGNDKLLLETTGAVAITNLYDGNGALTNRSSGVETNLFTYNLEGRLASVEMKRVDGGNLAQTNRYYYNASQMRTREEASRSVNGGAAVNETNIFVIDPQNLTGFSQVLEELPSVGATPTVSYTLGSQIIAQEKSGTVSYLMGDGQGSTRLLTDDSQNVVNRFNYDGYGTLMASNAAPQTAYLYTGQRYDSGLRQYYLRARHYNPAVGRFSAMDQMDGNTSDPLSLHKYAYAQNDPVNKSDPSGNETLIGLSIAVSLAVNIQTWYNATVSKVGDMLQTESEAAGESVGDFEHFEASSDTADIIIHGVEGPSRLGGGVTTHTNGWSKPFQDRLKGRAGDGKNENISSPPLVHDFYEFNWGGFNIDVVEGVFSIGIIPVKPVHQLAFVHLSMAQTLIWMKGYNDMNVISHSWGTTLAYDLLNSGGIEMKHWVTMGSPLNHNITKPVWNGGLWINAYSMRDPIVFLDMYPKALLGSFPVIAPRTGIGLVGHQQVSQPAIDTTDSSGSFWSLKEHGAYWDHDGVIQRLRNDLQ